MQSQKTVSAYFTSKQILPFGFADQSSSLYEPIHLSHMRNEVSGNASVIFSQWLRIIPKAGIGMNSLITTRSHFMMFIPSRDEKHSDDSVSLGCFHFILGYKTIRPEQFTMTRPKLFKSY